MALTKAKKQDVISEVEQLLANSKLTVVAQYQGTTVKALQQLRKEAKESNTTVKVIKNRLVRKAIANNPTFKDVDTSILTNQLIYSFNNEDEVAPAQVLATFKKTNPTIVFVGAFNADGQFVPAEDVIALANLPSKDQLRAQLVGTIAAPLTGFANVVNANIRSVLNVLQARAESI